MNNQEEVTMGEVVRRLDDLRIDIAAMRTELVSYRTHADQTFVRLDVYTEHRQFVLDQISDLEKAREEQNTSRRALWLAVLSAIALVVVQAAFAAMHLTIS